MKKLFILLFTCSFLSAAAQNSARIYIEKYKYIAIEQMNQYGLPASVILGVSMHESGNGTSKIARYLNNHFGMKGKNSSTEIRSSYRGYGSVKESYDDFIGAMNRSKKFRELFTQFSDYDYRNWVLGIQRGGYAASKTWGSQVLATIRKYKLYEYDNRPENYTEPAGYDNPIGPAKAPAASSSIYKVKKGDTLLAIAKRYGISLNYLMSKNSLSNSHLAIGQILKL